jgi:hypothetical protein
MFSKKLETMVFPRRRAGGGGVLEDRCRKLTKSKFIRHILALQKQEEKELTKTKTEEELVPIPFPGLCPR